MSTCKRRFGMWFHGGHSFYDSDCYLASKGITQLFGAQRISTLISPVCTLNQIWAFFCTFYLVTSLFLRLCPGIYLSQSYSHMCTKFDWNRAPRRYIFNNNFYAPWRYIILISPSLPGYLFMQSCSHISVQYPTVNSFTFHVTKQLSLPRICFRRLPSKSNNLISSTMWIIEIPCLPIL
jgi:hypothetical protein